MTTFLRVEALSKSYGSSLVVDNITFSLDRGEIGCLLGPSGCGKTTLLRSIAGFENIESGSIALDGEIVSGPRFVPAEHRRIASVITISHILIHEAARLLFSRNLRTSNRQEPQKSRIRS